MSMETVSLRGFFESEIGEAEREFLVFWCIFIELRMKEDNIQKNKNFSHQGM